MQSCLKWFPIIVGGSTITNIINRYADSHELKMALPIPEFYRFKWPNLFHWSAVDLWRLGGKKASMLSNHARYDRPAMQLVMREGAKYITILRHPVTQYESMFDYMHFNIYFNLLKSKSKTSLEIFFENPTVFLNKIPDRYV